MRVHKMNAEKMSDQAISYNLLKTLEANPILSQRYLAKHLGVSLGKINFCLNALIEKGCLKVNNFRNNDNKMAYSYLLTPHGVEHKARMTVEFLQIKIREYECLRSEIAELTKDAEQSGLLTEPAKSSTPPSYKV
jgi:EPS-associated MarR family transcriptional regulator